MYTYPSKYQYIYIYIYYLLVYYTIHEPYHRPISTSIIDISSNSIKQLCGIEGTVNRSLERNRQNSEFGINLAKCQRQATRART